MVKPHSIVKHVARCSLTDRASGVSRQFMQAFLALQWMRVLVAHPSAFISFGFGALIHLQKMPLHDCQVRQLERD